MIWGGSKMIVFGACRPGRTSLGLFLPRPPISQPPKSGSISEEGGGDSFNSSSVGLG